MDGVLMRAATVHELGATPAVEQRPEPVRGAGQALVEMAAVGLNPVDIAITGGVFYAGHPPLPFTAGREGVGRVVGADGFAPGALVYTLKAATGSLADRFVVDESQMWELPAGTDPGIAAALGIAGMAAWVAVEERARLSAGERVLVLGATGAVGSVAVQAARLLGAGRIVAAGRDAARLERARRLGADAVVHLGDDTDLEAAFRDAFPDGGPEVVIDPLWGAPALAAMRMAPLNMRLVNLGQAAGAEVSIPSAAVRGKRLQIIGHTVFETPIDVMARAHLALVGHATSGDLVVEVETHPLDDVPEAWHAEKAGPSVKLVVVP
jgi:NADPH2:quinone reductase